MGLTPGNESLDRHVGGGPRQFELVSLPHACALFTLFAQGVLFLFPADVIKSRVADPFASTAGGGIEPDNAMVS